MALMPFPGIPMTPEGKVNPAGRSPVTPGSILMACPECDLLHRVNPPPKRGTASCTRCGAILRRGGSATKDVALALHVVALTLFLFALSFPLLTLHLHGTVQETSIPGCARILANLGWPWLAAVLITTVILAPLVHLGGMIYVLLQIRWRRPNRWTARVFRIVEPFGTWGMAEVFLLGIIVSYVKLAKMAVVVAGPSLYALGAFIVAAAAAVSALDIRSVWESLGDPPEAASGHLPQGARTAREANLAACSTCGRLSSLTSPSCPRCGTTLHSRKLKSRERTWALLLTAILLYLPANLLPVMQVVSLGRVQADTIMGGILYFLSTGSWPLALLIFIASVVVPIVKIVILAILLVSERRRSALWPEHRARLYRLTDLVGRWSMVDIFVITLMVAMVALGSVARITPGPGSVAFALMVVSTILAVQCFDPRLVWDSLTLGPQPRLRRREDPRSQTTPAAAGEPAHG
jgi:paraquat-inducible protein A